MLWFEMDEWCVVLYCVSAGWIFGGIAWLLVPTVPYFFIKAKRKGGRGYFKHLLYFWGLTRLKGYPSHFIRNFQE